MNTPYTSSAIICWNATYLLHKNAQEKLVLPLHFKTLIHFIAYLVISLFGYSGYKVSRKLNIGFRLLK